jgi:hypothetical protein
MAERATILRQRLSKSSVFYGTWWLTSLGDTVCVDSRRRIIAANAGSGFYGSGRVNDCWSAAGTKLR